MAKTGCSICGGRVAEVQEHRAVVFNLTGIAPTARTTKRTTTQVARAALRNDQRRARAPRPGRLPVDERQTFSLRYSFSNNKAVNANATGNALSDTTVSALSNNGTEKDRTNTVVGQYTTTLRSNILSWKRAVSIRARAAHATRTREPLMTGAVGNVGTVSFLGENIQHDWRLQARRQPHRRRRPPPDKAGPRVQPRLRGQKFGFDQFGTWTLEWTPARQPRILSVGWPDGQSLRLDDGDLPEGRLGTSTLSLATDELAFFTQDAWRVTTSRSTTASARKVPSTPRPRRTTISC